MSSKAIFTGTTGASQWNGSTIHIALPPAVSDLPRLDEPEQKKIADSILPQLLRYRFDRLRNVRDPRPSGSNANFPATELAHNLVPCLPDDQELASRLLPLLEAEEQERRQCNLHDVRAVIIEVLWTKLPYSGEVPVAQLAISVNADLRSRGLSLLYSAEEVGWKLRDMGIPRPKTRDYNVVRFSRETNLRIHQLARYFGLKLSVHPDSCVDCATAQGTDS